MKKKLKASAVQKAVTKPTKTTSRSKTTKRIAAVGKKAAKRASNATKKRQPLKRPASKHGTPIKKAAENEDTIREFRTIVNIDADQLKRWLETAQSRKLERLPEYGETSTDARPNVLRILEKRRDKYTDDDLKQMRNVIDHINRRLIKRPKGDIVASNWRYSLMNWGHDPTKRNRRTNKL